MTTTRPFSQDHRVADDQPRANLPGQRLSHLAVVSIRPRMLDGYGLYGLIRFHKPIELQHFPYPMEDRAESAKMTL